MKECRISKHNQVIEVFEAGKYDGEQFDFIRREIQECPNEVKPLMWYIDKKWMQEGEYSVPAVQSKQILTGDQVIDILLYLGYDLSPFY